MWSADRFSHYPITPQDLNDHYAAFDGTDCHFSMTAYDETGPVGHLLLRFLDEEKATVRFGFVIVDSSKRGKGYGRELLELAIHYAFDFLKVEKITLGVFAYNTPAHRCYQSVGFRDCPELTHSYHFRGRDWTCLEMELTE